MTPPPESTALRVTSEPVPAVVGHRDAGQAGPLDRATGTYIAEGPSGRCLMWLGLLRPWRRPTRCLPKAEDGVATSFGEQRYRGSNPL